MSYNMVFWKETSAQPEPPASLCERIDNNETIEGIAELPIDKIKARFAEVFVGIEDTGSQMWWEGPNKSGFVVSWPRDPINALTVECGYQEDTLNKIIELANEFGCALYDPQADKRFDQPGIKRG